MRSDLVRERSRDSCWRKAAMLLAVVDQRRAVAVLRGLESAEVLSVAGEMALIRTVDSRDAEAVLRDYGLGPEPSPGTLGGLEKVHELLVAAFGSRKAAALRERIEAGLKPAVQLTASPSRVADALSREGASTAAAVLAKADPGAAAQILSLLPIRLQVEITGLIGRMRRLRPDALVRMSSALAAVITATEDLPRTVDGPGALEAIVTSLPREGRQRLLESLRATDPELLGTAGPRCGAEPMEI